MTLTTRELLQELERRGVTIQPNGERLRVEAPTGALTDELREELTARKVAVMALLSGCCPVCSGALRMSENDRYRYEECEQEPLHYFNAQNKRSGKPMGLFADYVRQGQCSRCQAIGATYSGHCEDCLRTQEAPAWVA